MSRSFKVASFTDNGHSKKSKKQANKVVRHTKNLSNGGAYKRCFEQWEICDYRSVYFSKQDYDNAVENKKYCLSPWYKWVRK